VQRILQLGVGGGMKAGVNVWQAIRDVNNVHRAWEHLKDTPLTGGWERARQASRQAGKVT
jgi:hypothetical protein